MYQQNKNIIDDTWSDFDLESKINPFNISKNLQNFENYEKWTFFLLKGPFNHVFETNALQPIHSL